jgi:hypothetical protein
MIIDIILELLVVKSFYDFNLYIIFQIYILHVTLPCTNPFPFSTCFTFTTRIWFEICKSILILKNILASSTWSTFTIEIWSKIYKCAPILLDPFPYFTCFTFTTKIWSDFFIVDPIFTYPFPCSIRFIFTFRASFCNSSSIYFILTIRIGGFNLFLSIIALGMRNFKKFCSSSFTLLGREDILWELICFRGDHIIILSKLDYWPWNKNEMDKMRKKFNKIIYYMKWSHHMNFKNGFWITM